MAKTSTTTLPMFDRIAYSKSLLVAAKPPTTISVFSKPGHWDQSRACSVCTKDFTSA
jgi:hypothetical protein